MWELFNRYTRIFSFRLGILAGSRSRLVQSMVGISQYCMWGVWVVGSYFFFSFCSNIVGTVVLEGLWFAVNEIHKASTWEEQGIDCPYLSLSFGRGSFSEHLHRLGIALSTPR